ncbi:MAG TPA: citrate synthase [Pseudomonadales bacterium]|nr:citrate synthase [Pseudomonadales bacterium]
MTDRTATLTVNGNAIELPIHSGNLGPDVVDVAKLTSQGCFTYDPGFVSTAACESKLTYIDGDKGILLHGGYPIDQLAEQSSHMEVCYLLLNGELPNAEQLAAFEADVNAEMAVDPDLGNVFNAFSRDAHPMAMLTSAFGVLAAKYHNDIDNNDPDHRRKVAIQVIAKTPTIAAMCYRYSKGLSFIAPRVDLNYAENYLNMTFGDGSPDAKINPTLAKAMDRIFILHADHEQNASTSTVRLSGSTGTNPFAAIAAGVTALWGPSHGGANEAVLEMLNEIGDVSNIDTFIERAKDRDDPFRLMGFGHRVYKNLDPRARVMKISADEVLSELGKESEPLLAIAKRLERIAIEDSYFAERKLYPNVDFYSGLILQAIGIPTAMFTVIFALGRCPGWIAHWCEMMSGPLKIGRPRQLYTGPVQRNYVSIDKR